MDKDNKKFPFEKERFEEKFPSKKETFVIRKKRRQILVLFLSFSGYILRGFHTYSRFHSLLISPIPLSTYHHPSETPYPSHLQNGDRLLLTYHLIYHLSPPRQRQCRHTNQSPRANKSINRGQLQFQGRKP